MVSVVRAMETGDRERRKRIKIRSLKTEGCGTGHDCFEAREPISEHGARGKARCLKIEVWGTDRALSGGKRVDIFPSGYGHSISPTA